MAVIHIGTMTTLGAVPVASCTDGDIAYVWHESFSRKMVFDDDGTNATDEVYHPYYRRPDDYVDGGVWIEDVGAGQPEAWSADQIATGSIKSLNWIDGTSGTKLDLDNELIAIKDDTLGNSGIQLGWIDGKPQLYMGDGSDKYLSFDGTDVTVSGLISGSYLYGSSLMTKGTYLSSSCNAADGTLNVGDTTDFATDGGNPVTAWIIDSANDRDAFTYTGKTDTTLTGCSGVLAHTVSAANKPLVVPYIEGMYMSDCTNELRFFGNRGDGTIEELANIGIKQDGAD